MLPTIKPCDFSPMLLSISSNAPSKLEIEPSMPWLIVPSIPWNFPPSEVASINALVIISAEIAPSSISFLSLPIDLPVCSLMTDNGLKPALIICKRSCPISLPVERIWANARTSELNLSALPIETSPIARRIGITSSAAVLNERRVCAPFASSCIPIGVVTAKSLI